MMYSTNPHYEVEGPEVRIPQNLLAHKIVSISALWLVAALILWVMEQPAPSTTALYAPALTTARPVGTSGVARYAAEGGTGFDTKVKKLKEEQAAKRANKEEAAIKEKAFLPSTDSKVKKPTTLDLDSKAPIGPNRDSSLFPNMTQGEKDAAERKFIRYMVILFVVILLTGLTVAASGFLGPEGDAFVLKYIFPLFTPLIGTFLLLSTAYGFVKSKEDPDIKF